MNQKLPYEQLIAEKMQHLPLPDQDESWREMKSLLDSEMPAPPGGGRNGFRPGKSWWIGAVVIVLLGGAIGSIRFAGKQGTGQTSGLASNLPAKTEAVQGNNTNDDQKSNQSNDKISTHKLSTENSATKDGNGEQIAGTAKKNTSKVANIDETSDRNLASADGGASNPKNADLPGGKSGIDVNKKSGTQLANSGGSAPIVRKPAQKNIVPDATASNSRGNGAGIIASKDNKSGNKEGSLPTRLSPNPTDPKKLNGISSSSKGIENNLSKRANASGISSGPKNKDGLASLKLNSGSHDLLGNPDHRPGAQSPAGNRKDGNTLSAPGKGQHGANGSQDAEKDYGRNEYATNLVELSSNLTELKYTDRRDWMQWGKDDSENNRKIPAEDLPSAPYGLANTNPGGLDQKQVEKQMHKEERKTKRADAATNRKPFFGEKTDRWFAAGLAPYQNFAVASQQSYNYNSSANKGTALDYLPAPYLQFHLTDRVYVLGEFQFNSPQATSSLLLSNKEITPAGSQSSYIQNIYLRKLYYFNMPFSFYYSPVKNIYFGSGLQFSSLNSGIAYLEQKNTNNQLLYSETFKIKEDSLAAKLSGSEWRYLFDANYYWKRFMFGFRYNQALGDYIDLRVNNVLPPSRARNQAFQLYFRYNIIVSGRKDSQYDPLKY
jgi:hypothetical protein